MLLPIYFPYCSADKGQSADPTTGDDQAKTGTDGSPKTDSSPRTFTQEQVNEIVGERLKRAEESAARKLLEAIAQKDAALAQAQRQSLQAAIRAEALKQHFDEGELGSVWLAAQNDPALTALLQATAESDFAGVELAVKKIADAHPRWLKTPKAALGTPPRTSASKPIVEQPNRPLVNF
jgi:hypothetical protein